jgi:hypothetical protein
VGQQGLARQHSQGLVGCKEQGYQVPWVVLLRGEQV